MRTGKLLQQGNKLREVAGVLAGRPVSRRRERTNHDLVCSGPPCRKRVLPATACRRIVMEDDCARLREKDDIKEFYLGMKETGVRGERRWKKKKTWR